MLFRKNGEIMIFTDDDGRTYVLRNITCVSPVETKNGYNGSLTVFSIDMVDGKTYIISGKEEKLVKMQHKLLIDQLGKMK